MRTTKDRVESSLDDALDMTFPASDPIAVFMPVDTAEIRIERLAIRRSGAATGANSASADTTVGHSRFQHRSDHTE